MIKGIGVDLVQVSRIAKILAKHDERLASRLLTDREFSEFQSLPNEIDARRANFLAKRFAVKEAVSKALGTGFSQGVSWKDIELGHLKSGQPTVMLKGIAKQLLGFNQTYNIHVSLSDDAGFVTAYVLIELLD